MCADEDVVAVLQADSMRQVAARRIAKAYNRIPAPFAMSELGCRDLDALRATFVAAELAYTERGSLEAPLLVFRG